MFLGLASPLANAQFGLPLTQTLEITPEQGLLNQLPRETQLLIELNSARAALKSGNYEAVIDTLQPLLEVGEDYFEVEELTPIGSTLDRIEALLWSMPDEAIETYRRRYEQTATSRLDSARGLRNPSELLNVARIYPLTLAAATATQLAGEVAFDQGETALAARLWEKVLSHVEPGPDRTSLLLRITRAWTLANQPGAANKHLQELNTLAQAGPLDDEGRNLTPPPMADAEWLNKVFGPALPLIPQRIGDWRMAGGHPRRWGSGEPVSPLLRGLWSYPLIDQNDTFFAQGRDTEFQSLLKEIEKKYQQNDLFDASKTTPLVIGAPLVVGDNVLVQGLGSVKALDARTGELRWSGVARDDTFLYWTWRNYQGASSDQLHNRLVEVYLGQRAWLNQTGASLSSDGQQVYAISGTGMVGAHRRNMFMRQGAIPPPQELTPPRENRLLCYDLATGLLKWEAGGPSVATQRDEDGFPTGESPKLPGAFFLGAPLPVDGQLFTLAEDRGQIQIFSLSPQNGEVLWSMPLLNPESGIDFDETRRLLGLSPAYAGGLLICPTGEGVVVAVDPLLRRVVWIQQYNYNPRPSTQQMLAMPGFRRERLQGDAPLINLIRQRRWFDNTPILTAGRVLLPATECNKLLCFDSETGQKLWEMPRGDSLFVAACTHRHCLIVGERTIQSYSLADGKFSWSQEIPPPTGRGVVTGQHYLLPVSSNEILAIDMKTGRTVSRTDLPPTLHAGSLAASHGQLLMQTTSELIGLKSLSEVQTELARDLTDPTTQARALAEQGQLLLFQGKETEAVELLQKSLAMEDSPETRKLLVWCRLERLKVDYEGSRIHVEELKKSITDPEQKRLLNQILAEAMERSGESLSAFREYLELVPTVGRNDSLQNAASDHQIRSDRWLRGRLTRIYSLASEVQQEAMQAAIQNTAESLAAPQQQMFARVLGIDLAPELYLQLALNNQPDPFIAQRVLWTLSESPHLQWRGPAVARLIRNLLAQSRMSGLQPLLSQLQRELAKVECEPGVTGEQVFDRLQKDKKSGAMLAQLTPSSESPMISVNTILDSMQPREPILTLGARRGPFASGIFTIEFNPTQAIQWSDSNGRSRPIINLATLANPNVRPIRYIQTDPQLALFVYRDHFALMSPSEASGNQYSPRLQGSLTEPSLMRERMIRKPEVKPGVRDTIYPDTNNVYQGNVGPLTFDTLCYLSGGNLIAIHPAEKEGKPVWKRTAVPSGSEICADSQYVVLIPPLLNKLVVLRTADGSHVAERDLPRGLVERLRADWGRLFLVRRDVPAEGTAPAQMTWAMYDPAFDRDAWSVTVPAGTLWAPVDGEDIALLEPGGTLHLIDDQTGIPLWKTTLPSPPQPAEYFTVQVDGERVYVHTTHKPLDNQPNITEVPATGSPPSIRVNGLAVALNRRDGTVQWSRPIEQQMLHPLLPEGSGVLAYATLRKQTANAKPDQYITEITFLSRSTGEPLFAEKFAGVSVGDGWKRHPNGVLQLQVAGHDFMLTWKADPQAKTGAPEQTEPVPEEPADQIKLQ